MADVSAVVEFGGIAACVWALACALVGAWGALVATWLTWLGTCTLRPKLGTCTADSVSGATAATATGQRTCVVTRVTGAASMPGGDDVEGGWRSGKERDIGGGVVAPRFLEGMVAAWNGGLRAMTAPDDCAMLLD